MVQGRWPLIGRDTELLAIGTAIRDGRSACLVLAGAAGVGKSRLASEAAEQAERNGFAVRRVLATKSASGIPLGAFAAILPDAAPTAGDAIEDLLRTSERFLVEQVGGRPLLLLVDDAQNLDDISAALVLHMVSRRVAFVLETVRSGVPVPDATAALWKEELGIRMDLGPLDEAQLGDALARALGGPVDGGTTRRLAHRAEGNMLFLTQLVDAALDQGALVRVRGLWRLAGPLDPPERLAELLEARLGALTDEERSVLEVIAIGEPLGFDSMDADEQMLASLEARGLVTVTPDGARTDLRLRHPMHGELLRSRMTTLRERAIARQLANTTQTSGARRRGDVMRIGAWRLEAHDMSDPDLLTEAAAIARSRFDLPLAERLALAALSGGGGFQAGLLAGESAIGMGRAQQGAKRLAQLVDLARDDAQRASLASIRIQTLVLWLGRTEEALEVADAALAEIADPTLRADVGAQRAMTLFAMGRARDGADALRELVVTATGMPLALVTAQLGYVLAQTGAFDEALSFLDRSERESAADPELLPAPILWSRQVARVQALELVGRIEDAVDAADRGYRRALELGPTVGQAWMALMAAQARLAAGRAGEAVDWALEAIGLAPASFLRRAARATLTLALAQAGRAQEALDVLADVDTEPMVTATREVELLTARAWAALASGDADAGRAALVEAVELAVSQGTLAWGATAAHDLARIGHPDLALTWLRKLAGDVEGPLLQARLRHCEALIDRDPARLAAASEAFERLGALLLAADAAADASAALDKAGDARGATAAGRRAQALCVQCGRPRTPALDSITALAHLTKVEREIALLAASGKTNKAIAAERVISLRTVENTLRRVYMKLGIDRRDQISGTLDPPL
jgi:DNA-binding CsgD family transcriptional regulator